MPHTHVQLSSNISTSARDSCEGVSLSICEGPQPLGTLHVNSSVEVEAAIIRIAKYGMTELLFIRLDVEYSNRNYRLLMDWVVLTSVIVDFVKKVHD